MRTHGSYHSVTTSTDGDDGGHHGPSMSATARTVTNATNDGPSLGAGTEHDESEGSLAPLLHVVLDRPAIAGNVGAVVRLCAATGAALHVCGSLLAADDREMWRSGLDYWPRARVHFHDDVARCLALLGRPPWVVEVGGTLTPWDASLRRGDIIVLGPEKGSVDTAVVERHRDRIVTLPQRPGIRSLNLAQCAAVVVFEAMRQQRSGIGGGQLNLDV
jgi:tRNA (cytidine/uridine-2'-O-)-methyltransferase